MFDTTYLTEVSTSNGDKDLIHGVIGWQSAVEDVELSLETLRDVIPATAWLDHGSHVLDVNNVGEVTWFLQVVEAFVFHRLTNDLIGDLKDEVHKVIT